MYGTVTVLTGQSLTIFELTISDLHNKVVCFEVTSVSYTHLTLPTNREV